MKFNHKMAMLALPKLAHTAARNALLKQRVVDESSLEVFSAELLKLGNDIIRARRGSLIGILNGIDTDEWNPAADPFLPAPYDAARLEGKAASKRALLAYIAMCSIVGTILSMIIAYLGFRDGGFRGAYHRLRYPLANWGEFGPTGGRFIDHNDDWIWRRYAIAWLYFWLWLSLPLVAMLR